MKGFIIHNLEDDNYWCGNVEDALKADYYTYDEEIDKWTSNEEDATFIESEAVAFKVSDLLDEKYAETSILKVPA